MGIAVLTPRSTEARDAACAGPENNGAGGSGLFGLPLYLDDGVPGRGLPLRSEGSYAIGDGGGFEESEELLEGDTDRVLEFLAGMKGRYEGASAAEGARLGALSNMEGGDGCGTELEEDE